MSRHPAPGGTGAPTLSDLNPAQQEAVRYLDGACLIVAGAGSGKTRVITAKLLHLIDSGLNPGAIAAITFTNKAAREMLERFDQSRAQALRREARGHGHGHGGNGSGGRGRGNEATELASAKKPTICTFHSLGMRMLRSHGRAVGLKPSFSILDSGDCESMMSQMLGSTDRRMVRATLTRISNWKNAMVDPDTAARIGLSQFDSHAARAYRDYQATLEGYQAVDFDDLIRLPLKMMREHAEAAEHWRARMRYVLVDEYQDTNAAQYELLREIVKGRGAFTAVGDDDQSIYGWRGATLENLRRLGEDFPKLKVIKLEQNYRSTRAILSAANELIAHNPKLHEKKLWSALGLGDPIKVIPCDDDQQEAETVVTRLSANKHQKKAPWSDFAILYRSNQQARVIEQMLRKEKIPYAMSGGQSFFDRAEIRDLCAYLRLLANDDDDPALIRAITTPRRGVGAQTLKVLGDYAGERHQSLFAAMFESGVESRMPERQLAPLREFGQFINRMRWRAEREPSGAVLDDLIKAIGYEMHLRDGEEARAADTRWQNVCDFRDWIAREGENEGHSLVTMAQRIALITMLGQREKDADAVQLSTIHAAKGLEYAHVFLIGVEQGLMPHAGRAEGDGENGSPEMLDPATRLQEERRLMYVAITRARRTLTLTWCRQRKRAREMSDREPSPFIAEMGLDPQGQASVVLGAQEAKERLAALRAMLAR